MLYRRQYVVLCLSSLFLVASIYRLVHPSPVISSETETTEATFSIDPSQEYQFFSSKEQMQTPGPMEPYVEFMLMQKLTANKASAIALMNSPQLLPFYEKGFSKETLENLLEEEREEELYLYLLEIARKSVTPEQFRFLEDELHYDILATVAKAKIAFYDFLESCLAFKNYDLASEIAEEGLSLAYEVHMAGNVPDALLLLQKISAEEATLERSKALQKRKEKKRNLLQILRVSLETELVFEEHFPSLPFEIPSKEQAEKKAIANNIFLKTIKETVKQNHTLTEEEKGQLWMEYAKQASCIREKARSLGASLKDLLQRSRYQLEVVRPLEDKLSFEMLKRYNAMEITPLELMDAKQKELQRAVKKISTDRDFFVMQVEVEMLMSGALRREM